MVRFSHPDFLTTNGHEESIVRSRPDLFATNESVSYRNHRRLVLERFRDGVAILRVLCRLLRAWSHVLPAAERKKGESITEEPTPLDSDESETAEFPPR
ncbi:hypothetical protein CHINAEXTREME_02875 [Halobiforma lacisalsi AJ5]|uniref:Uncharacterized protein n=1 Tax=Natronobacterium lacisalsi AJ5 TaxID=358396 RepID=A0A1P8LLV6_NATLA|nr:hypothetical protein CHINAEXTREME_02875 [Halobiforma lacisalsi AJ5]